MSDAAETLRRLLSVAKAEDCAGYNKHDGLLSPALNGMLGWSKIGRLLATQLVTRAPWNVRPLVGVPKTRNPKGIGLFAHADLVAYNLFKDDAYLKEAQSLLGWLMDNPSEGFDGACWGYQYPWQDVGFYAPAQFPNRVVTCWIGFAFHQAWVMTKEDRYLQICRDICIFLLSAPNRIVDTPEELCLSYVPDSQVTWAVMDVSALCGKMLALTGMALQDQSMLGEARRCIRYVVNCQTSYGAWFYTDPPGDSHIRHDNYHTGIILDCLLDYMLVTGDNEHGGRYAHGLRYYDQALFSDNGAPRWMNNRTFPHDIHGAAQGIITFSKAAERDKLWLEKARQILAWTMESLYDQKTGFFWYQQNQWYTKRFTLMRWCNAWMAMALGTFLGASQDR